MGMREPKGFPTPLRMGEPKGSPTPPPFHVCVEMGARYARPKSA